MISIYYSLEFDFEMDELQVVINIPPFPILPNITNPITNASDYLNCFIAARNGQPSAICASNNNPYPFTLDKSCRDAICDESQRHDPNPKPTPDTTVPTESQSLEPTLEPTELPTSTPTSEPTLEPTGFFTIDPTDFPTQIPTEYPTEIGIDNI